MTSQNGRNRLGRVECLGWGLIYGVLAALPLCGLVLFLQITRPAHIHGGVFVSTEFASYVDGSRRTAASPLSNQVVARLNGVSAELGGINSAEAKLSIANNAALAFNRAPRSSLKAGFRAEFVTKDHHRVAIRIIRREPITDRAVPDNSRLMDIVPASTANTVRLAWGNWLYVAEFEDKGVEPEVVVQEVL
jgi:hypothetical protein